MLERCGFDDVVAQILEVGRRTWDGADIGDPIMEGRNEMVEPCGCNVHYRRDVCRARLSQERDITPDMREAGHVDGGLGQGPA